MCPGKISRMRGNETPKPIWIKFGVVVDFPDVVTYTNFGDHPLRGFWVAGGQIFPFPTRTIVAFYVCSCLPSAYCVLLQRLAAFLECPAFSDPAFSGPAFSAPLPNKAGIKWSVLSFSCASVHQAAKLVAALLRVATVTAGLAESNGSLPPGL